MTKATVKTEVSKFEKAQICSSVKYSRYKDILSSQLKDNQLYGYDEIDKIIDDFMKGKVK